jgi:hypothetical protein
MKQIVSILLLMTVVVSAVHAQWSSDVPTSSVFLTNTADKVGVGTNTPQEKLHINGAIRGNAAGGSLRISTGNGYLDLGPQNANFAHFGTDRPGFLFTSPVFLSNGVIGSSAGADLKLQTGGTTQFTISQASYNVGIGVSVPVAKLHLAGQLLLDTTTPTIYTSTSSTDGNKYVQLANSPALGVPAGLKSGGILVADEIGYANPGKNTLIVKGNVGIGNNLSSNPHNYSLLVNGKVSAPEFYINDQLVISSQWTTAGANVYYSGGVGIGTPLTDNPRGYKLAVNGKIGAKDVRVENASTTWPDYVFEPSYNLPSLYEIESYIKTNKHLQDVPSAEQVRKEGHELGSMDAILLKKVEELTLLMIELRKENDALRTRLDSIEQKK